MHKAKFVWNKSYIKLVIFIADWLPHGSPSTLFLIFQQLHTVNSYKDSLLRENLSNNIICTLAADGFASQNICGHTGDWVQISFTCDRHF